MEQFLGLDSGPPPPIRLQKGDRKILFSVFRENCDTCRHIRSRLLFGDYNALSLSQFGAEDVSSSILEKDIFIEDEHVARKMDSEMDKYTSIDINGKIIKHRRRNIFPR